MPDNGIKNKSLYKALRVLECFNEKQPLSVSEISEKLDLYKSNVHDILTTFKTMGYLEQDVETKRYTLGPSVVVLNRSFKSDNDVYNILMPYVRMISEEAEATVYLSVPRRDELVYLEVVYAEGSKLMGGSVNGESLNMFCTGAGKAILAEMDEERMQHLLEKTTLEAFTEYTITDKDKMREEIEKTRERGYGIDDMELAFGYRCVGISIRDRQGIPEAGISISAPTMRMNPEDIERYAEILLEYKRIMESKL